MKSKVEVPTMAQPEPVPAPPTELMMRPDMTVARQEDKPAEYTGMTGDLSADSFAKPKIAVLNGTSKLVTGEPYLAQGGISLGDICALKPRSDKVLQFTPIHLDVWQQEVVPYMSGITPRTCRTRAEAATWGLSHDKVGELGILYCAIYGPQGDMLESAAWESLYQFSYKQEDGKIIPVCFARMYLGRWEMARSGAAGMVLKIDIANVLKKYGGPIAGVYRFTTKAVTTKANNTYYVPVFTRTGFTDIAYRQWLKEAYTNGTLDNLIADAETTVESEG
jgi:hypothetical protein